MREIYAMYDAMYVFWTRINRGENVPCTLLLAVMYVLSHFLRTMYAILGVFKH